MRGSLFNGQVRIINVNLAVLVGLPESAILQQIHYWHLDDKSGVIIDGNKWIYNTISGWNKQFPFWSEATIKRTIARLKEIGLLEAKQLSGNPMDRTTYYRINYAELSKMENASDQIDPMGNNGVFIGENGQSPIGSNCANASDQIDPMTNIYTKITKTKNTNTKNRNALSGKPDVQPLASADTSKESEVIEFLSERVGKSFKCSGENLSLVKARLREGATVGQMKSVIRIKSDEWGNDEKMCKYLRPATLFAKKNFERYKEEAMQTSPSLECIEKKEEAKKAKKVTEFSLPSHLRRKQTVKNGEICFLTDEEMIKEIPDWPEILLKRAEMGLERENGGELSYPIGWDH